jgi:hypothetical protein
MAITYPVDVENTKWTLYNTSTSEVVSSRNKWGNIDGEEPVGLNPDFTFLLEQADAKPTYDSATHKIEKTTTVDVPNNTITQGWSAVALTQAESDERIPAHYETNTGIKMATDLQSQAAFSNMMILLNEAGMADTDPVAIKDCFGVSHGMTVAEFRTQAVAYGLHCYTIFHS